MVFTPRTGVKDDANAVVNMRLPGLASELCGVEIEEYQSMPPDDQATIHFELPGQEDNFLVSIWAEALEIQGAEVVASYQRGAFAGKPAITRNYVGKGQVIYIGIFSIARFYESLARWLLSEVRINPPLSSALGVEITERWQGDDRLLFLLNHHMRSRPIRLNSEFIELISGKKVSGEIQLGPRDVMILKLPSGK